MKIILLSGGSGRRLWPLSNDIRSKQFLKLLCAPDGSSESMVQRITRQISEAGIESEIIVATSDSQYDSLTNQLGYAVDIVTEPERRDTFPAVALSASYLIKKKKCDLNEVVVVMPSDSYVETSYFESIARMVKAVECDSIDMVLMGITPTEPSTKFGYITPSNNSLSSGLIKVERFTEKPEVHIAKELIAQGAVWNGGVFAFKLGYISQIIDNYLDVATFEEVRERYSEFKKISFDYEVVESAKSIGLVPYSGVWSDLGTWDSLSEKINNNSIGNVITDGNCRNTHIINELNIPIINLSTEGLIIAASPDGIVVSSKEASSNIKSYADRIQSRPMYEERRWGTYKVLGHEHFSDGHNALSKLLCINSGCNISYQYHNHREEIWTFVDGEGILVIDDQSIEVSRGYVAHIKAGQKHAVKAISNLQIIEVQTGNNLVEDDIIRLEWNW